MPAPDLAAQQRYRILRGGSPPAPSQASTIGAHYDQQAARVAAQREPVVRPILWEVTKLTAVVALVYATGPIGIIGLVAYAMHKAEG